MLDIITFGSASRDTFIVSKEFKIIKEEGFRTKKGLCVSAESKLYIDKIFQGTGGGGTNTAATFALQGFSVAYLGMVGKDEAGRAVRQELKDFGVATNFIIESDKFLTMQSFVLSSPAKTRTILVYQGACNELTKEEIPFERLVIGSSNSNNKLYSSTKLSDLKSERRVEKPSWFYISSLSGHCAEIFEPLINFAHENKIKIAVNPGQSQLELKEKLVPFLNQVDVLFLNQEEASFLTGVDYQKERAVFKKLDDWVKGTVVMTKGPEGVVVSDGQQKYSAGIPKSGIVDRTGAGDAFGAGFVSALMRKESIEQAIQLGTAIATACLQEIGAKRGLLKKGEWGKWPRIEVKAEKI